MILHAVEQNTPEWIARRLGIACSSEFHKIMTPKTRKLSSQAPGYMYRLLGEWLTGESCENVNTEFMQRGHDLEDQAVLAYELLTERETERAGFITTDDGMVGCSPDRLIGTDGDLEIKCPLIQTQVKYALEGCIDDDYMCQLQGRMLIHGRQWIDIFSFHPKLSIPAVRVRRDEEYIADLAACLDAFTAIMLKKREELETRFGPFIRASIEPENFISEEDAEAVIASLEIQ